MKNALILDEEFDDGIFRNVINKAYAPDLTDEEMDKVGGDPCLIVYAFAKKGERVVVTKEASKPKRERGNRKLPDACIKMGIRCIDDFEFYREMDFRIP